MFTFGYNENGQLGLGHRNLETTPCELTPKLLHNRTVVDVCCGYAYTVAITCASRPSCCCCVCLLVYVYMLVHACARMSTLLYRSCGDALRSGRPHANLRSQRTRAVGARSPLRATRTCNGWRQRTGRIPRGAGGLRTLPHDCSDGCATRLLLLLVLL